MTIQTVEGQENLTPLPRASDHREATPKIRVIEVALAPFHIILGEGRVTRTLFRIRHNRFYPTIVEGFIR